MGFTSSNTEISFDYPSLSNDPPTINDILNGLVLADFNGDGLTDIASFVNKRNGMVIENNLYSEIYYSTGFNFSKKTYNISNAPLPISSTVIGDWNGDGRTDILRRNGNSLDFLRINTNSKERLLDKIADGMNNITTFAYKYFTDGSGFYQPAATAATYPIVDIVLPVCGVFACYLPNGNGGAASTFYTYQGSTTNRYGRGYLGFQKVVSENASTSIKSVTEYDISTGFMALPKKQTNYYYTGIGYTQLSETVTTNTTLPGKNSRYRILPTLIESTNSLIGAKTTTANTYDIAAATNTGNLTQSVVTVGNATTALETTTTDYTNYGTYGSWMPNKPTDVTVTKQRGTQAAFTNTVHTYYNMRMVAFRKYKIIII